MSNNNETKTVEFDAETVYSMTEAKSLLKQNKGRPLPGLRFYAESPNGEKTLAVVISETAPDGKVQASLKCLAGGPDHIRRQSDWHQSLRSPEMSKKGKKAAEAPQAEAV